MSRNIGPRDRLLTLTALCVAFCIWPHVTRGQMPSPRARIRVLFIGNSFTYTNNLPEILRAIGRTAMQPVDVETEMVAEGGATLVHTWDQGVAVRRLAAAHWDYVVLQEQSLLGNLTLDGHPTVNDPAKLFYQGVGLFGDEIQRVGAKTVLMLTWAPRSEPALQDALTYAYMSAGRTRHAAVAPVGLAWQEARRTRPQLDLFDPAPWDGMHPSPAGSYLAAAVLYAEIVGRSPVGATAEIRGHPAPDGELDTSKTVILASLDTADARWLQKLAWKSYTALKDSGGYVSRAAPRRPQLPAIPPGGLPLGESDLVGYWSGHLDLYYNSPAHIELNIARGEAGLTGTLRISPEGSGAAESFPISAIHIVDGVFSFTVPNRKYETGAVTYTGVLTGRGLAGIAEIRKRGAGCAIPRQLVAYGLGANGRTRRARAPRGECALSGTIVISSRYHTDGPSKAAAGHNGIGVKVSAIPSTRSGHVTPLRASTGTFGAETSAFRAGGFRFARTSHIRGLSLPKHSHELASIKIVLGGVYAETIGGTTHLIPPGNFVVKPPELIHSNCFRDVGADCLLIELDDQRLESVHDCIGMFAEPHVGCGALIVRATRAIVHEMQCPCMTTRLTLESLGLELILALHGEASPSIRAPRDWLRRLRSQIEDTVDPEELTLARLSATAGVPQDQIARHFRSEFGIGVGDFARQIRIQKAARAVRETDLPLAVIALTGGFFDQSHFTRCFKRYVGTTPSAYRRHWRAGTAPLLRASRPATPR